MRESEPIICMDIKTIAALKENPQLGVAIAYKDDTQKWGCVGKDVSSASQLEITDIMMGDRYKTFAIINQHGELCHTNSEDPISVNRDQNDFIHINNNEYLIKPIVGIGTSTYIGGQNLDEINFKVQMAIDMGFVRAPEGFGPNGFENPPIFDSTEQCQDAQ